MEDSNAVFKQFEATNVKRDSYPRAGQAKTPRESLE